MHRGSHHYGVSYDSFTRRGYPNNDAMLEVVQQFREFKPYLKKRLQYIMKSGRDLELQDEVQDIKFFLHVMTDILADETHGVDQLRSYIDKIHEMIRKNPTPITDLQGNLSSLDATDNLNDNDHPRSPSPEARGEEDSTNCRLIPTHGGHRTVEVSFTSRKDNSKSAKEQEDEWGSRNVENSFTRREHYKDVDMRQGFYEAPGSSFGRGQRRWSGESDFSGARGMGRGHTGGRDGPPVSRRSDDYRRDRDSRSGHGRGYDNDRYDDDWFRDRSRDRTLTKNDKESEPYPLPAWLTGAPTNGNAFDEWAPKHDNRDSGFRSNFDRRPQRDHDEWNGGGVGRGRGENREDRHHRQPQHHQSQHYERRPSTETRREERNEELLYERRPRNDRPHESSSRQDVNSSPVEYNHGPSHSHTRRREDEDNMHMRGRMDGHYPPHAASPNMMNPMTSIHMSHPPPGAMGYNVGQPQHQNMHYSNTSVMAPPPTHYPGVSSPLLPLPVPNAPNPRMNLPIPNVPPPMAANVSHPMSFQPPPVNNFVRPEMHGSPASFTHVPPPQTSRPPPTPHHHTAETFHGGSPGYASPVESADRVREISMLKAKQCFGRTVSRPPPSGPPPQASPPTPSTVTSAPVGPLSPKTFESSASKGVLDPRLNRVSRPQARQQSPPAAPPPSPLPPQPPTRPDAGNVLRADPRKSQGQARGSIDEGRRKLQETRDRVRDQEASRKSHHNKVSKIQELRKQLEKEGLHRLGRPAPKKPVGSFEDAISYDNEADAPNKPNEKSKSRSPSKEKESDERHHGRSHSDKTDRDRSPKKTEEKNKSKDKSHAKDSDSEKKKDKSGKKKSEQGKKSSGKAGSGKGSKKKTASDNQEKGSQNQEKNKLAGFKIPRKPKPVPPPEPEVPAIDPIPEPSTSNIEKSGHEVSTSPPASPEPALTQVPDVESRTDDAEPSTSSTKPTTPAAPATSTTDEINPDALEFLKQFLITSMQPEEREHILGNQENLTNFFYKIKSEIVAAKEKHEDSPIVPQVTPGEADSDKSVVETEDGKERGRCREKRKNSKRRSSLEKLHDALKEMRFDTMLPLGPRRCTRGGQEEAAAAAAGENAETTEPLLPIPPPIVEPSTSTNEDTNEQQEDSDASKTANKNKKRGRPPKPPVKKVVRKVVKKAAPKKKRQALPPPPLPPSVPASPEQEPVADEEDAEIDDSVSQVSVPTGGRGRKRKLKPTKPVPNKRAKKSGPVTRAQAALKNAKELKLKPLPPPPPPPVVKKWDLEKVGKPNKTTKMMARRLTRHKKTSKVGALDTAVNVGLGRIKIEADFTSPPKVKPEPHEVNPLLNTSGVALDDDDDIHIDGIYLADQLDNIINENLDCDTVINMDRQTEENMDLDVFNTLDADESEISTVKNELNMSMDDEPYFQGTLVGRSLDPSEVAAPSDSNSHIAPNAHAGNVVSETGAGMSSVASDSVQNDKRSLLPTTTLALSSTINLSSKIGNGGLESSSNMPSSTTSYPVVEENVGLQTRQSVQEKSLTSNYTPLNHDEPARTPSTTSLTPESTELEGKKENTIPSLESSRSASPATTTSSVGNTVDTSEDSNQSSSLKMKQDASNLKIDSDDDLRKGVFKCEACSYTGKKIISHYVNKHPQRNIPQATLMQETFNGLIELNTSQSPQLLEIILDEDQSLVWPCLYCDDRYECVTGFYDHLTSHTGEFRFECTECGTAYPYLKSLNNHAKSHKGVSKSCVKILFESGVEKGSKELSGFLCNDCYYFQLRFEGIIRHIEQTGHSSLDVKSVRLIRPCANSATADSNPSVVQPLTNEVPEKLPELSSQPAQLQSGVENTEASQIVAPLEPVNDNENVCVFFGTNVNFTPPSITLNECSLAIPPVFAEPFLDGLLMKVRVDDDDDTDPQLQQKEDAAQARKRKRADSEIDQSEQNNTTTAEIPSTEEKSDGEVAKPRPKTIHNFYPNRANSARMFWNAATEIATEEPNDFFVSSDESSDDSDSDDSEVVSDSDASTTKPSAKRLRTELQKETPASHAEASKTEFPEGMRNNEHLVKLKVKPELELEKSYVKSRNVVAIRRAGDLCNPNTVLFGYIMPGVLKNAPKLRDCKEVEKLSHVTGRRSFPVKNVDILQEMLTIQKLMHLFKCMGTYCTYTTECAADFYNHLHTIHFRSHEIRSITNGCSRNIPWQNVKLSKDADCCSYCSARYKHAHDMVDHVVNQHGQSAFQCSKCFYRSFYHRYVVRHFDIAHPNETVQVLKCGKKQLIQSQEATLFQIFVYKCDIDNPKCDKTRRFVFREDFMEHLQRCIPPSNLYPCHLCKKTVPLEELIEHYKLHNLFKFHCSYCQFGSEVKSDLDEHFVLVHPNTSGRVFYRVKPAPSNPGQPHRKPENTSRVITELPEPMEMDESSNSAGGMPSGENQAGADGGPMDISENEDSEKGRVTNLKGRDLYRCVTGDCDFAADDSDSFKAHVTSCGLVAESRSLACAHCERKMKTVTNLLEHMKVHGEKKQICSLCPFRSWTSTEVTKHFKTVHRVMNYKLIKKELSEGSDPDVVAFAKDVAAKMCTAETFANNYYLFTRKALYSFDNIDKLPQSKVFSSDLYCALCPYSSKVRSNIVRHLTIHKKSLEDGVTVVPQAPRINPVPYLSRESLEFDKMMNLAASSHKTDGGTAREDEVRKLPQFVKEQFRYVCSICEHMTSDEGLLQTHIKVIHSEVTSYRCPHCQKNPGTKDNPEYIVSLDKIAHHLRLHGPKLFKCGHCMMVQHQVRAMEKHIPEKHPEKKPIHYLIRDVDPDGVPSSRPSTSAGYRRHSADDSKGILAEKWKCFLCSSKSVFGAWEEIKAHCESVHKVNSQFMCLVCDFASDDVSEMLTHCQEKCKSVETDKILVMFSKCETFDEDSTSTMPMWKKHGGAVRHIHGNFTEDSVALIRQYNNQQNSESNSLTNSPLRASTSALPTKPVAKPSSATSKARRSTGGSTPTKFNVAKAILTMPLPPSPPKMEVFKYHCHKCDMYKTKNPNELRIHLFNEFRYKRWKCLVCNLTFTTEKSLKGHIERDHQKVYQPDLYYLQPPNPEIEAEIDDCIERQNRKKDLINSFAIEKLGKLSCKHCKEDGLTYSTFETHILQKHSG